MAEQPPTLRAVRVANSTTWHLTWQAAGEPEWAVTCCGLRVHTAAWEPGHTFLTIGDGGRCALCHDMSETLFIRSGSRPGLDGPSAKTQILAEVAPGVVLDLPSTETPASPSEMPGSLLVGPYEYSLEIDSGAVREFGRKHDGDYAAFSEHGALRVRVADRATDGEIFAASVVRAAVLHEALHCVLHVSGWSATAAVAAGADEVEEYTVGAVESSMWALVRDNPGLMAWLG